MIPGLRLLRRTVTLGLCAVAFLAGVKIGGSGQAEACAGAGGSWDARGFCAAVAP
jgi:hypothetical protein